MSALSLSSSLHHAYMAGKYSADAEQYLQNARIHKRLGGCYAYWIKAARTANRRMVDHLRSARRFA
jgi:hypothetical protein